MMDRFDRRWVWTVLGGVSLAASVVLPVHAAGDEDIFSAQVPPNVVLMVDNSGSMNSIMQHPSFDALNFTPTCTVLASSQTTATVKDQLNRNTNRVCGGGDCRFEVSPGDAGWVATPSTTDNAYNGYIVRRFCGRDRKLYTDGVNWGTYNNKTWYEQDYTSPFMVLVYKTRAEKRELIPAVNHVDDTGRVQTVEEHVSPRYYRLIREFAALTGVPILLNTSFNENEPIVTTPEQALDTFAKTRMDLLVVGNHVVRRGAEPGSG